MNRQFSWLLWIGVFLISSLIMTGFRSTGQINQKNSPPEVDFSSFPIVDSEAPAPTAPSIRAKRAAKSKKYNSRGLSPIGEWSDGTFVVNEVLGRLPALPVAKSSVVLLGEILNATAHLSEDRTTIYSEFEVRIETLFKNSSKRDLTVGNSVEVERLGGRVRLPSGKIVVTAVDNQDMPRVGKRYLIFLTNDFPGARHSDEDFNILTAYEIRAGKVFPLDKTSSKHPISRYMGKDDSTLLIDLTSALTAVSPN